MKHKYDDIDLFKYNYNELPIVKHLKLGTFFTGIGSPEGSLKDIGITYNLQFFSEINKNAIKAYCEIHKESFKKNKGDIAKIKGIDLPYCDMWFGGFPCTDISLSGNRKGFSIKSESRSSLGWEMIRLLKEVKIKPKYIVFENVAAISNKNHAPILKLFKDDLKKSGYTLYDKVLNSKNYGSKQSRNRYFLVAILGKYTYVFPNKQELVLESNDLFEGVFEGKEDTYPLTKHTITKYNKIFKDYNVIEYISKDKIYIEFPPVTREGQTRMKSKRYLNRICPPLLARDKFDQKIWFWLENNEINFRRLTTSEYFKFMGFTDEEHNKAITKIAKTYLYEAAGNSIDRNVLRFIFINLLLGGKNESNKYV